MIRRYSATPEREGGQILALFAAGLIAILAMTALVIDGGNVFAQQRITQNGADATSQAGALVLAQRLAGAPAPTGGWDAAVQAQITSFAAANGITVDGAYYTDICGIPLRPNGDAALLPDGRQDLATAAQVGTGIPVSTAGTPDCPAQIQGPPAGVLVIAHKDVETFIARVVGITEYRPTSQATAVAGWLTGICDASQGDACTLLPVTIPTTPILCDGQNRPLPDPANTEYVAGQVYKIPLCSNSPGNVGWLDWTPPAGGSSELADSIRYPNNPPLNLPGWYYVTETGNTNSSQVESAMRYWDGQVVLVPMFDLTCNPSNREPDPNNAQVNDAPLYGCPSATALNSAAGQNLWYRLPNVAAFELCDPTKAGCLGLHGSYIQGNNRTQCDTGNGATSCLIGRFVNYVGPGQVSAGVGGGTSPTKVVGVQLVK